MQITVLELILIFVFVCVIAFVGIAPLRLWVIPWFDKMMFGIIIKRVKGYSEEKLEKKRKKFKFLKGEEE